MALPRKHNLDQMKRLRSMTKGKDIGDIVAKGQKNKEKNMPNVYRMDNPLDREIDTYESFIKKNNKIKTKAMSVTERLNLDEDAFIVWENYLADNEEFVKKNYMNVDLIVDDIIEKNEYKEGIENMKGEFYEFLQDYLNSELVESVGNRGIGPGNLDFFSNNFKQVLTSQLSTNLLQLGKFVKVGKIEGIIEYVDKDNVYISKFNGETEKISFKNFLKQLKSDGKINENSGFPSEFWSDYGEPQRMPERDPYEPDVEVLDEPDVAQEEEEDAELEDRTGRKGSIYGTEDDPMGLRVQKRFNENVYHNDYKTVRCNDCGKLVEDTYEAKLAHIYNVHFKKPSMDGSVPQKKFSYDTTWPQGGREAQKLISEYFPES